MKYIDTYTIFESNKYLKKKISNFKKKFLNLSQDVKDIHVIIDKLYHLTNKLKRNNKKLNRLYEYFRSFDDLIDTSEILKHVLKERQPSFSLYIGDTVEECKNVIDRYYLSKDSDKFNL